jgi:hypothetical protein
MRQLFDMTVKPVYCGVRDGVNRSVERRHGIETLGVIELEELGLAGPDRQRYKPVGWTTLRRILPRREVGPQDVFIDFGSGLGRAVYQAALLYPFRRVIGVELSEQLNVVARRNLEHNRDRLRCHRVELITSDVLDYEIPDDVTVAFIYNSFQGQTFAAVIDGLLRSLDARPRRLRLIYANPVEQDRVLATGRFRQIRKLRGMRPSADWARSNSTLLFEATQRVG